jgi:hypothetical protein
VKLGKHDDSLTSSLWAWGNTKEVSKYGTQNI